MLEMLQPIATALGYLILIPALGFVVILFLCATITLLYLTLRWVAQERMRRQSRVVMADELADLKRVLRATPDEISKMFSRSSLADANQDYLD